MAERKFSLFQRTNKIFLSSFPRFENKLRGKGLLAVDEWNTRCTYNIYRLVRHRFAWIREIHVGFRYPKDEADVERISNVRNRNVFRDGYNYNLYNWDYLLVVRDVWKQEKFESWKKMNTSWCKISPMQGLRDERKSPVIYYGYWRLKLIKKYLLNCINFKLLTFPKKSLIFVCDIYGIC